MIRESIIIGFHHHYDKNDCHVSNLTLLIVSFFFKAENQINLCDPNDELVLNKLKELAVKNKRVSFFICGNSNVAKSICVNHLLQRQLIPINLDINRQNWKIIKIKVFLSILFFRAIFLKHEIFINLKSMVDCQI